jgi:hypothetical protein
MVISTSRSWATMAACGVVVLAIVVASNAAAQERGPERLKAEGRVRYELAIGAHSWPGLGDLQPAAGGTFDELGFGLGGAIHWPVWRFVRSELLLGIDLSLMSNSSNIPSFLGDVLVRDVYLGPSLKWVFGQKHRYSLDAGITFHEIDIADVTSDFYGYAESEIWGESAVGGYVGSTVDIGAGIPDKRRGMTLAFRVHFVDFGVVADENLQFLQTLGPDAGVLSGPVYVFQIGYRWR